LFWESLFVNLRQFDAAERSTEILYLVPLLDDGFQLKLSLLNGLLKVVIFILNELLPTLVRTSVRCSCSTVASA
jgi:hypothetical protein